MTGFWSKMISWHVFGRKQGEDPLGFLGLIKAVSPKDAVLKEYGDEWLELVAIPEDAIIKVI